VKSRRRYLVLSARRGARERRRRRAPSRGDAIRFGEPADLGGFVEFVDVRSARRSTASTTCGTSSITTPNSCSAGRRPARLGSTRAARRSRRDRSARYEYARDLAVSSSGATSIGMSFGFRIATPDGTRGESWDWSAKPKPVRDAARYRAARGLDGHVPGVPDDDGRGSLAARSSTASGPSARRCRVGYEAGACDYMAT
jgi:hypothetical protein